MLERHLHFLIKIGKEMEMAQTVDKIDKLTASFLQEAVFYVN
jgi:hypothetical protein